MDRPAFAPVVVIVYLLVILWQLLNWFGVRNDGYGGQLFALPFHRKVKGQSKKLVEAAGVGTTNPHHDTP